MDGKLLVLCDELPDYIELEGEKKDKKALKVYDRYYLVAPMRDPAEDPERLFVCWDSIVPEDRAFIEDCKRYARFEERPDPRFVFSQRGATDPRHGTIKGSVEEQSYLDAYNNLFTYLSGVKMAEGDLYGEMMERAVQFPFEANQRFFEDFSRLLQANNVVRILPAYSVNTHAQTAKYRADILEAWEGANRFMPSNIKSGAKVLPPMTYTDIGEVFSRSINEMMTIYSLPIFGEAEEKPGEEQEQ